MLSKSEFIKVISLTFLFLLFTACSQSKVSPIHSPVPQDNGQAVDVDPYQDANRKIFGFNKALDDHLLKPVAKFYRVITPEIVDNSVSNFFSNLDDVGNAFNNILQLKPGEALIDTERFLFNSLVGIGGLFDVSSIMGMEKHDEDFGQTLAHWGVESGPYVMLPLLGPSTVRDAVAKLSIDRLTSPTHYHKESLAFTALDKLDQRADLFLDEEAFENISDDQYSALRDLWLQRRASLISDGKVEMQEHSDLIDELEALE